MKKTFNVLFGIFTLTILFSCSPNEQGLNDSIKSLLTNLEKDCYEISFKTDMPSEYWNKMDENILRTSMFVEGLERDKRGNELVFQVYNFPELTLPKSIPKLKVYANEYVDKAYAEIVHDATDYISTENMKISNGVMIFKKSKNLPDWETLKKHYSKEHQIFREYFKTKNIEQNNYSKSYDDLVILFLGHPNPTSTIGGNINQLLWGHFGDDIDEYNFIMQLDAVHWGNLNMIYLFQNKNNPKDIKVFLEQT